MSSSQKHVDFARTSRSWAHPSLPPKRRSDLHIHVRLADGWPTLWVRGAGPWDQCKMTRTLKAPLSFSLLPETSPKSSYSKRRKNRAMKYRLEHGAPPKGQAEEAVPCSPVGARSMWL